MRTFILTTLLVALVSFSSHAQKETTTKSQAKKDTNC